LQIKSVHFMDGRLCHKLKRKQK